MIGISGVPGSRYLTPSKNSPNQILGCGSTPAGQLPRRRLPGPLAPLLRSGVRRQLAATPHIGVAKRTYRYLRRKGSFLRVADHPDHCRSGPLESPHQSVEPGCGFVEAFEHVDLAVLADKRDGESVAVRMNADAPGQDGVRRRIQRGELLLQMLGDRRGPQVAIWEVDQIDFGRLTAYSETARWAGLPSE